MKNGLEELFEYKVMPEQRPKQKEVKNQVTWLLDERGSWQKEQQVQSF